MSAQVLAAMSGGVDSSVAAALLVDAGFDVTGVHLKLSDTPARLQVQGKGCFIPDGDTAGWLERRLGRRDGEVVDAAGTVLGRHEGAYRFTVGQRRGLGVAAPAPRYVLRVEPAANQVVVGGREDLAVRAVELERSSATDGLGLRAGRAAARLRAHGAEV